MRLPTFTARLLGAGFLAGLVATNNPAGVLDAVMALRLQLVLAILFHAVPLWLDVVAWQGLLAAPPGLAALFGIRWIAEGVNGLSPVPHLGELLRADLTRRIARPGEAGASVVVDVTLGVATQVLFGAVGLGLFALVAGGSPVLRGLFLATGVLSAGALTFQIGLALSLAKRCRELALGLPALLASYVIQARRVATAGGWPSEPPPA